LPNIWISTGVFPTWYMPQNLLGSKRARIEHCPWTTSALVSSAVFPARLLLLHLGTLPYKPMESSLLGAWSRHHWTEPRDMLEVKFLLSTMIFEGKTKLCKITCGNCRFQEPRRITLPPPPCWNVAVCQNVVPCGAGITTW
jgi:hypothetical protein